MPQSLPLWYTTPAPSGHPLLKERALCLPLEGKVLNEVKRMR